MSIKSHRDAALNQNCQPRPRRLDLLCKRYLPSTEMWGWGGSSAKNKSKSDGKQKAAASDNSYGGDHDDLAGLGTGISGEFDDFSDSDMNDPALLAELAKLADPPPKAKAKPKAKPSAAAPAPAARDGTAAGASALVDVESIMAGIDLSDDKEIPFDESDMNDPELLAALGAIAGGGGSDSETNLSDEENHLAASPPKAEDSRTPEQMRPPPAGPVATTPTTTAPPQTKPQAAPTRTPSDAAAAVNPSPQLSKSTPAGDAPIRPTIVPPPDLARKKAEAAARPANPNTLEVVSRRQLEYKKFAQDAKRAGDVPRARDYLIRAKRMQDDVDALTVGAELPPEYELPPHPSTVKFENQTNTNQNPAAAATRTPTKSAAPSQTPQGVSPAGKLTPAKRSTISPGMTVRTADGTQLGVVAKEKIDLSSNQDPTAGGLHASTSAPDLLQHFETTLENQIATCTNVAAHYFKQNKKQEALAFHQMKKAMLPDLETIRVLRAAPNASNVAPPAFRYTTLSYDIEQVNPDVDANEMMIEIVRAWDLGSREIKGDEIDSYVAYDIGWPPEDADALVPVASEGKGDTSVVKRSGAPDYSFTKKIPIVRTRPFQRFLERKKATFEVFHYHRGFLLMSKKVSLGRIQVPLTALLTKCEVHEAAELADANNPRKLTGGKLEVRIKMRTPLVKPDIIKKEQRWLTLDFGGAGGNSHATPASPARQHAAVASAVAGAVATVANSVAATSPVASQPVNSGSPSVPTTTPRKPPVVSPAAASTAPSPAKSSPATASPASAVSPGTVDEDAVDDAALQFESPDNIVSNGVLEKELGEIDREIVLLKTAKKPIPDSLTDRKMAYQLRMNTLVFRVQTGALSMADYVVEVKASIQQTKKWALMFKDARRMDLAKTALARIKMMQGEVAEVEAALAEGGGG
ncbi:Coiled-coil and C2 domain-containing protein 1B [Geranomyces variabilis]|uniref:Coiled-coil and C2 domain-containing protein 1B n=1 Tax=Geranomyces variabilis TaxID=109894 RepID=A0AAD5TFJ5_9FUNG|nr:Coiled-coil and C2 domain-containing protein 1B [Geranomyces variabilis]